MNSIVFVVGFLFPFLSFFCLIGLLVVCFGFCCVCVYARIYFKERVHTYKVGGGTWEELKEGKH